MNTKKNPPPPPIDPLDDLNEACFKLLGTLQNINKEDQTWHDDFQKSMITMSAAMNKFIQ